MDDEDQEDIDMESARHQQELESRRWYEEVHALETDLLKAWFEWCRESDKALRPRKG